MKNLMLSLIISLFFLNHALADGHVNESKYSKMPLGEAIKAAYTSENLTNADLAWHAVNTYGWDCNQVTSRGKLNGEYYVISCSSGKKLRVYPRKGMHPSIRNINGGWN